MRTALVIGALAIAATCGAMFLAPRPVQAANVYIDLYASLAGWNTTSGAETNPGPTITTSPADSVTVNLTSDSGTHTFLLDYDGSNTSGPAEPFSPAFTPTTPTSVTFNSAPPGTYFYICTLHGFSQMRGVWIVLGSVANDTTPPAIASAAVTPPSPVVNDSVMISASVTDPGGSGVASVSAHVVGPASFDQNLTMTLGSGSTYSVNHAFATAGTYAVTIWARDAAGNNASHSLSFTVSSASPPTGGNQPTDNTGLWAAVAVVVIIVFLLLALAMRRRGPTKKEPPEKEAPPEP